MDINNIGLYSNGNITKRTIIIIKLSKLYGMLTETICTIVSHSFCEAYYFANLHQILLKQEHNLKTNKRLCRI